MLIVLYMPKNQELVDLIKKIKYHYNLNQSEIASKIGISKQYLSDTINGRYPFSEDLKAKLYEHFTCINTDTPEATPRADLKHTGVRLVSQYAYAGYLTGYMDETYMAQLPVIDFTPDREMTGNYLAFEVRGDSMDDGSKEAYVEGELLICREVEPHLWRESRLHFNKRDFVIVHTEGILIKRVIAHDVANHNITIHSLNPLYPDRVIDLADVRQIFSVVESRKQRSR